MNASSAEFVLILGIPVAIGGLVWYEYQTNCASKGLGLIECTIGGIFSGGKSVVNGIAGGIADTLDSGVDSIIPCGAEKALGIGKCGGQGGKSGIGRYFNYTPVGQLIHQGANAVEAIKKSLPKTKAAIQKAEVKVKNFVTNQEHNLVNKANSISRSEHAAINSVMNGTKHLVKSAERGIVNKIEHPIQRFFDRKKEAQQACNKYHGIKKSNCKIKAAFT